VALRVHEHVQRGGASRDYKNDNRAPLLFISGGEDHLMPPAVQRSNARHYKSNTITEVKEYPGYAHLLPAQDGWEEIADYALSWAISRAGGPAERADVRRPEQ
jgi:pimeloyl-ACP methyl ester carboxylesterase